MNYANSSRVHFGDKVFADNTYLVFVWFGTDYKQFCINTHDTDIHLGCIDGKSYNLNLNHGENEVYTYDESGKYMQLTREEQNNVLRQLIC